MKSNREYVIRRDRLIPRAARYADFLHPQPISDNESEREEWVGNWNRAFHSKMNDLSTEQERMVE